MKVLHVVGARPNFMKVAPIMEEMARYPERFQQVLVHTGQHYDANMSAGLRSFNRRMPEEINRVVADCLADLLSCPTQTAVDNLAAEGITRGVHLVGDVMADALAFAVERALGRSDVLERLGLTIGHRASRRKHRR